MLPARIKSYIHKFKRPHLWLSEDMLASAEHILNYTAEQVFAIDALSGKVSATCASIPMARPATLVEKKVWTHAELIRLYLYSESLVQ